MTSRPCAILIVVIAALSWCAVAAHADDGASEPPAKGLARGLPCNAASECESGYCADGICCDTACTGDDDRCDRRHYAGTCTRANGVAVAAVAEPAGLPPQATASPFGIALGVLTLSAGVSFLVYREATAADD